ncbi:MAG TPA: response regulator transcription factor [Spirochaetota bacterium]|nr:response regulator transcription factor [Spirochaetota bacterium]HRZ27410.1 response regulator transcription factor [Spirochaetota bacterium]HSA15166.1 response regulator transcription factor [Spirochaetota bacterium]
MPGETILIIDDEEQIRRFLKIGLESQGYLVHEADSGGDGLTQCVMKRPDAVLLDLNLPDMDGAEVLKKLREWYRSPVIVLTVRESERDKVELLDCGADDYITKPFGMEELLARMRAVLRRARHDPEEPQFDYRHLSVDLAKRTVTVNGLPVKFSPLEYDLLKLFVRNPGKVLTQKQIMREIWGPGMESETSYLRVYVAALRKKIEEDPSRPKILVTEPGVGYRFAPD